MHISDDGLKEFIAICKEDYGVDLSEAEARVCAIEALLLYELISRPLPSELAARQQPPHAPHPEQAVH
jgi:hypothetical protein